MWYKPYKHILEAHKLDWLNNPLSQPRRQLCIQVKDEIIAYQQTQNNLEALPPDEDFIQVCIHIINRSLYIYS